MAALQMREDPNAGRLILQPALTLRLGNLVFGLVWLAGVGIFLLPMVGGGRMDWFVIIAFLFFAFIPVSASFLNAIFATTVTIDRGTRTLSSVRSLLFLPLTTTTFAFNDLAKIEVQYVAGSSAVNAWRVNAVSRDNKRSRVNWNGAQREMIDLAQKISALTSVPVSQAEYALPTALQDIFKKIAPTALEQTEKPERAPTSPPSDSGAPPPVPTTWTISPTELQPPESNAPAPAPIADDGALAKPVWDLSVAELEQRIANDSMEVDARYALARRYHARGDLDRAITLYRDAARLDPTNPNVHNDLGVALQLRGKRTEAEAAYRRAVALDPFSSIAHLNLALLLRVQNRATDASQEFFLARQGARNAEERNAAEAASGGAKMDPQLSKT